MGKEEAISQIIEDLETLVMRVQGFMDWEGEISLQIIAENIYDIARTATD